MAGRALQFVAAKSRKVGNEQPSKQPPKIAPKMVQHAWDTQRTGTPTDDLGGCLVAVSLTKDLLHTQRTSVRGLYPAVYRNREGRDLGIRRYERAIFPHKDREARNAPLTRVCHPLPLARSTAITSVSNQIVTTSLANSPLLSVRCPRRRSTIYSGV